MDNQNEFHKLLWFLLSCIEAMDVTCSKVAEQSIDIICNVSCTPTFQLSLYILDKLINE